MRDSLRPCNSQDYSTQFQIHDHPDYKPSPIRETPSTSKDTIQTYRNDLKQEALNRLRHTSDAVVYQKMALVVRIGKYLFLAAAVPPYLLLYSIPKWIVVEAIIPLFQTFFNMATKVQKTISERLEIITQKLTQILDRLRGTIRGLISPIFKFSTDIATTLKKMYDNVAAFLARLSDIKLPSFRPKFRLGNVLANKMNTIKDKIKMARARIRQAIDHSIDKIRQQVQDVFRPLTDKIAIPLAFAQKLFNKLNPLPRLRTLRGFMPSRPPIPQVFPQALQHSRQLAEQVTAFIAQKMHAVGKRIQQTYLTAKALLSSGPSKIWTRIRHALRDGRQGSMNFLKGKFASLKKRVNVKALKALVPPVVYSWIPQSIRQAILDFISKFFSHPAVRKVSSGMSAFAKVLKQVAQLFMNSLRLTMHRLKSFLKALGKFCLKFVPPVSDRIKTSLKKILYHSLVALFMVSILMAWGLKLVGETAGFAIRATLSSR